MKVNGRSINSVPGWFFPADIFLFDWFLNDQVERGDRGDLVELGTFYGKSAVVIAAYQQPGEVFTVVDLYESAAADGANTQENNTGYLGLTRAAFESHFRRFHGSLPVIVQGMSSEVRRHVEPGSVRFMHVDASHLYEHVKSDAVTAQHLLRRDGVVVFDDYRSPHTPGTAAAVWEAVLNMGLKPIVITDVKLYGTWGDQAAAQSRLLAALAKGSDWLHEVQDVAGRPLVRVHAPPRRLTRQLSDRLGQELGQRTATVRTWRRG